LPHGQEKSGNQEKSGKTKKNDKSQEKSGNFFIKTLDIVSSNFFNSFYFKAFD